MIAARQGDAKSIGGQRYPLVEGCALLPYYHAIQIGVQDRVCEGDCDFTSGVFGRGNLYNSLLAGTALPFHIQQAAAVRTTVDHLGEGISILTAPDALKPGVVRCLVHCILTI